MASQAYTNHLVSVLADAEELNYAHRQLRTGRAGRQWGLGSLNRATVVMCISAWESYVEEVTIEAVSAMRPPGHAVSVWQSINASARSQIGRFNNPNAQKTRELIADAIGLQDITAYWSWSNNLPQRARSRLEEAIKYRHQVAHGVNPRPTVHNKYSDRLPGFFRQLGSRTDHGIRDYLITTLGLPSPWP